MEPTITIPQAEYDALLRAQAALEDVRDNASVSAYLSDPAPGLPSDLVKRLVEGEPPLKIFREWRELSQNELARLSGVNRVQIGDIEDRGKGASVRTLRKLADALGVTIDDLID